MPSLCAPAFSLLLSLLCLQCPPLHPQPPRVFNVISHLESIAATRRERANSSLRRRRKEINWIAPGHFSDLCISRA